MIQSGELYQYEFSKVSFVGEILSDLPNAHRVQDLQAPDGQRGQEDKDVPPGMLGNEVVHLAGRAKEATQQHNR